MTHSLLAEIGKACSAAGLDLQQPLALDWYNAALPGALSGCRIPPRGAAGGKALCLLVANSKAIWEPFLEACAAGPDLLLETDPLDCYVTTSVEAALEQCAAGRSVRVFYSHLRSEELAGGTDFVCFQRMAHAAGLAHLDNTCHLSIHPKYGTWLSLRACIVFDDLAYGAEQPAPPPNPLESDRATQRYVRTAMRSAVHSTSKKFDLEEADVEAAVATLLDAGQEEAHAAPEAGAEEEEDCLGVLLRANASSAGCSPADGPCSGPPSRRSSLERGPPSRRASMDAPACYANKLARPSMTAVRSNWRAWVAVRDAPCPGHFWRFPDDMLEYLYTANREVLLNALKRRGLLPAPSSPDRLDAVATGVGVEA